MKLFNNYTYTCSLMTGMKQRMNYVFKHLKKVLVSYDSVKNSQKNIQIFS